jgi:hypothetical protein
VSGTKHRPKGMNSARYIEGQATNWTPPAGPTEFEREAARLGLPPEQWASSRTLKRWAQRYRFTRYVPEALLKSWQLDVTRFAFD